MQKLYGRDPGSLESVNEVFHLVLGQYPADKTIKAFTTWIERSQEFPTPADIIGLIKRNGKPPLTKEMYIQISKKDGEDRSPDDWQYMREYESEQKGEHWGSSYEDQVKESATLAENIRLRKELLELKHEYQGLASLLRETRIAKGLDKPLPSNEEKIANTIAFMIESGASADDIDAFKAQTGTLHNP